MSLYESLTIIFSSFALLISIIALVQNHRVSKRQFTFELKQTQLVEKQLKLLQEEEYEKQRAIIRLEVIGSNGSYKLLIRNDGLAPAFDLSLEIISREGKSSPIIKDDYEDKFPLKKLDPGDSIELFWAIDSSTGTDFDSICKWKNINGEEQIKETFFS